MKNKKIKQTHLAIRLVLEPNPNPSHTRRQLDKLIYRSTSIPHVTT